MVRLSQVSKRYGTRTVLQPLDLEFRPWQVTALIGPSGCGKSTLLRIIAGLIEPDSGEVEVHGERLNPGTAMKVRRQMGYVIQDGGLFPHLTAKENVLLLPNHIRQSVELDHLCQLTRFPADGLDRYPLELSGGQRQRVALMRALALNPSTLLLDEPLGALDPMIRAGLQTDLKEIFSESGSTVILVTHDMGEATFLADRIVLMRDGRIVQIGTLEEFNENPAESFVTEFLNAQRTVGAVR